MILHTLYKYKPASGLLEHASDEEYLEKLRHHPKKNSIIRSVKTRFLGIDAKKQAGRGSGVCDVKKYASPSLLNSHPYRFLLSPERDWAKAVGSSGPGNPPASTGTSQLNTLCITDGMGPCIAVAVGGEKRTLNGNAPGAKVRVFHVFPRNSNITKNIGVYIKNLQRSGLTVKVAMHGGNYDPDIIAGAYKELDRSPKSPYYEALASASRLPHERAQELRNLFSSLGVKTEFDEASEKRHTFTPLGVFIRDDNSVQFVTQVAAIVDKEQRLLPAPFFRGAIRPGIPGTHPTISRPASANSLSR